MPVSSGSLQTQSWRPQQYLCMSWKHNGKKVLLCSVLVSLGFISNVIETVSQKSGEGRDLDPTSDLCTKNSQ